MIDYPRDLLISEEVIRDFEERIGVRFIDKTECSEALAEHDAKVREKAFDEVLSSMHEIYAHNLHCLADMCEGNEQGYECKDCMYERLSGIVRFLKEQNNEADGRMEHN